MVVISLIGHENLGSMWSTQLLVMFAGNSVATAGSLENDDGLWYAVDLSPSVPSFL